MEAQLCGPRPEDITFPGAEEPGTPRGALFAYLPGSRAEERRRQDVLRIPPVSGKYIRRPLGPWELQDQDWPRMLGTVTRETRGARWEVGRGDPEPVSWAEVCSDSSGRGKESRPGGSRFPNLTAAILERTS